MAQTGIILKTDGTVCAWEGGSASALEQAPLGKARYVSGHMAILENGELWYWGSSNTFGVSGTGSQSLNGPVKVMDNVVNVWGENVGGSHGALCVCPHPGRQPVQLGA